MDLLTLEGTAQTATIGMYILNEYPYKHNVDTKEVSEPKHFINKVTITGRRNPTP